MRRDAVQFAANTFSASAWNLGTRMGLLERMEWQHVRHSPLNALHDPDEYQDI